MNDNMEKEKPILKLKPKFNIFTALSSKHLGTIFTLLFICILLAQSSDVNMSYIFLIMGLYIIYLIIKMVILKHNYKRTYYLFFEDRIVILKKNRNKETSVIPYDDIKDILFYQNYIQKIFNMGGLGIQISSGSFFKNIIMLESIEDLFGTIEKIRNILYN